MFINLTCKPFPKFLLVSILMSACQGEQNNNDNSQTNTDYSQPNIILIVVDDLRFDEFGAGGHPYLETPYIDRLFKEGAMLTNAYHATPLCSPNRASILTGQYASRHGILDNTSRSEASHRLDLFPKDLQQAGYRTAHVGKWHMGNDATPRPGYDYWVSFSGQGEVHDPTLYENDGFHKVSGYITDIFTDRALDFITTSSDNPFFLYIGHKAVHPTSVQRDDGSIDLENKREFIPAERHKDRYIDKVIQRAPSYGFSEKDAEQKPVLKKALDFKHTPDVEEAYANVLDNGVSEQTIRHRAEMVLSIDEGLGRIMDTLQRLNKLDDTVIIFTSDNGYFYGEHGLTMERRLPYEEAVHAPLLIRYPGIIDKENTVEGLATTTDIAPTVLELAGVKIPSHVQGKSLLPMLKGEVDAVHDAILMEYYSHENPFVWTVNLDYRVVRKGKYKYIRWIRYDNEAELYNLEADPYELNNLINLKSLSEVVADLKTEMQTKVLESMDLD